MAFLRWSGLLLLFVSAGGHASSYMHSESQVYYRGSLGYTSATETWDRDGDLQDIGCTSQRTSLTNQLEYGYSYYYNLFGRIGLTNSRCGSKSRTGLGDLNLGVRGRLNPYMNYRSWEVDVTIPLHGDQAGQARLGCGAFGLGASVDRTDRVAPWLSLGYGTGVKFWQAPLAHQWKGQAQLSGPFGLRGETRWSWSAGLDAEVPLNARPVDPDASVDDCGTQAKSLRAGTDLRYRYARGISLSCGLSATLWGEDVSRSSGLSCAFSRLWD